MNVQDPLAIGVKKHTRKDAHVARQADEIDLACLELRYDLPVVVCTGASATLDDSGRDSALFGLRQTLGARLVANNYSDLGVWDETFARGVRQRDHVRTAT